MLSILIPTYNYCISKLVRTLIDQLQKVGIPYEIRVYEDGSTQYLDQNAAATSSSHYVHQSFQTNIGRTALRAKLAKDAVYQHFLFLDADMALCSAQFIEKYLIEINKNAPVVFGGYAYAATPPSSDVRLRWSYGKQREARKASQRKKNPQYVISGNLLITKACFEQTNPCQINGYGGDNILSYQLKKENYVPKHIDNTVIHLGLEKNALYLRKTVQSLETLVIAETEGHISNNFTRLQKAYQQLKTYKLIRVFTKSYDLISSQVYSNLLSHHPSLFLFDLFKLNQYANLKKNA